MKITLLARALAVGAALALVIPTTGPAANAADVHVPDDGLRQCINDHLGHPADAPLAESEVASIEELDCGAIRRERHYNIEDLSGMEHLTGATRVDLGGNRISDLTPLAGLDQLRHLDLNRNRDIVDLSALSGLTRLQSLNLYYNSELEDISVIAGLTELRTLDLGITRVEDLSVLADLTQLRDLRLMSVPVSDLSVVAGLENLEVVQAEGAGVEDVSPLAGLGKLRVLNLGHNSIIDASALAGLVDQLESLRLTGQSLEVATEGTPVVVPPVLDASGDPVGVASCGSNGRNCLELVSTDGEGTTFTPESPGWYILRFEGTGLDDYSLGVSIHVTGTPGSGETVFSDNPAGSRFHGPIQWMAAEGISVGYADGTFKKDRNVSRGETAQFMYRMTDQTATATGDPFPDVRPVFEDAVSWFAQEEISVGYRDGTFRPDRPVTRGEFAAFLYRMDQPEGFEPPERSPFTDVDVEGSYGASISWLDATGITAGYGDGTFRPRRALSRAEAAAFLFRYHSLDQ